MAGIDWRPATEKAIVFLASLTGPVGPLAESHLARRLFAAMVRPMQALGVPAG